MSTSWEASDVLYLWAKSGNSSLALEQQPFNAYGIDGSLGIFKTTLASPMEEGNYEYMVCYPAPASASGTLLSFPVYSTQSGKCSDGCNVLVATPVSAGALDSTDPTGADALQFSMRHLTHVLDFYLVDDDDLLEGEPVKRISAVFSSSVTGDISVDLSDPSSAAYTPSSELALTLNLDEPLLKSSAGTRHYASANVLPHTFTVDEALTITLYTDNKMARLVPISLNGKSFEAGHATPVQMRPENVVNISTAYFTIDSNMLGEDVKTVRITGPAGCKFGDEGSNTYTYTNEKGITTGDVISISYADDEAFASLSGKEISIEFESEHAIVRSAAQIPAIAGNECTTSLNVPYLYFEDFSSTTMTNEFRSVVATGSDMSSSNSSNTSANLESYGWPSGWTGNRCGISAGDKIRLTVRSEYYGGVILGWGAYSRSYNGRVDSPSLSGIKAGKEVRIKLEFDYASGWNGDNSNASDFCIAVGTHKTSGAINTIGGTDVVGRSLADDSVISDDLSFAPDNKIENTAYPSETNHFECESTQLCDNSSRIVFETYLSTYSGARRYNYWVFIDNIKISILSD